MHISPNWQPLLGITAELGASSPSLPCLATTSSSAGACRRLKISQQTDAEQLKPRLGKICQYQRLNSLIKKVTKLVFDWNISFHWVDDRYNDGSREGQFAPDPNSVGRYCECYWRTRVYRTLLHCNQATSQRSKGAFPV